MATKTIDRDVEKKSNRWEPLKNGGVHKSSDEIEHEIDLTRDEMDRTLSALSDKFNPRHFVDDVKRIFQHGSEESREELSDVGKKIVDLVSSNPLSTALIGSGIGLFMYKNTGGKKVNLSREYEEERPSARDAIQKKAGEASGEARERMGQTRENLQRSAESARENFQNRFEEKKEELTQRIEDVRAKSSEKFSRAKETLAERMHMARERRDIAARQASEQANTLIRDAKQFAYDNPLAAGAAALAFGMLAGLLFPSTKTEKRTIGEKAAMVEERAFNEGKEGTGKAINQGKDVAAASAEFSTQKVEEKSNELENRNINKEKL